MPRFNVAPGALSGCIAASPSKSHSLRAILFATLAQGESRIRGVLPSPDTALMIKACRSLGAQIQQTDHDLTIIGTGGIIRTPDDVIDAGNSGQVLRFVAALASLNDGYTVITGDHSIRYNRPMQPLIDGLQGLDVFCESTQNNGRAPVIVKGPLVPGHTRLIGQDSQPVSALLMACAFAAGPSVIHVDEPGEQPWVGLTLNWFDRFNIAYENIDFQEYKLPGGAHIAGFDYRVAGDFSSLAFPVVAALVTQSQVTLTGVDMADPQGDKQLIAVLQQMGANIEYDATHSTLTVLPSGPLRGMAIDANEMIDAVPILTVMACYAQGVTQISGASIARQKESDRLAAIAQELSKMGADIQETADGLIIHPKPLTGANLDSHDDHRIVMSGVVAALGAQGESAVQGADWVHKSYPSFYQDFKALGAKIHE